MSLLAVGVERDAIEADYLKSNDAHRRYKVRRGDSSEEVLSAEVMALLNPLFGAHAEYLTAAFATIDEIWGSAERYFSEGLGLAPRPASGCAVGSSTRRSRRRPAAVVSPAYHREEQVEEGREDVSGDEVGEQPDHHAARELPLLGLVVLPGSERVEVL